MSSPSPAAPELSLVIVHWRAATDLAALLAAVPADPRWEVVVVDNGGGAPTSTTRSDVTVARPGRNLGFAGGADLGFAVARAPLLLLLNPDVVPRPGALEALLAGFAAWPDAAGLAPRLLGAAGEPQAGWQLRPLPRAAELLLHSLLFDPRRRGGASEPAAGADVEQPAAAALALRRDALERVGGLDPRFHPAWFEDVDLARRLRDRGSIAYVHYATFEHVGGATFAQWDRPDQILSWYPGLLRYFSRHRPRHEELAIRALAAALSLVRGVVNWPRNREKAQACFKVAGMATSCQGVKGSRNLPPANR